jgi:hypothetical protein
MVYAIEYVGMELYYADVATSLALSWTMIMKA